MYKTIKISVSTHELLKKFCKRNNLKLNSWVDSLILENMEKINGKRINENMPNM